MKTNRLKLLKRLTIAISYPAAIGAGILLGVVSANGGWMIITIPAFVSIFLYGAMLLNTWIEFRYVVKPYIDALEEIRRATGKRKEWK